MYPFHYSDNQLQCDAVALTELAARFGTPLYVYSAARIRENYRRLAAAFAPLNPTICYAVKANSNLAILRLLKESGAGFDIVSGGELFRVLQAGAGPARIVFAGVGKTEFEIEAALRSRVGWINVESAGELQRVNGVAGRLGLSACVAIRLRPDVDADTHHHISTGSAASKFGVPVDLALDLVRAGLPHVQIRGAHIHIGSQLGSPQATLQALEVLLNFSAQAQAAGAEIDTLDIGGGFPVAYQEGETVPTLESFAKPILARLKDWPGQIQIEPGRFIVADSAALVTQVQYEKVDSTGQRIVIVDAGMQTLIRPALYDAHHRAWPVQQSEASVSMTDLAGPICESADFLARKRELPLMAAGDLLALLDTGAYGFAMASNYNSHPLPAEVLVDGNQSHLIRRRQTYTDLITPELDLFPGPALG